MAVFDIWSLKCRAHVAGKFTHVDGPYPNIQRPWVVFCTSSSSMSQSLMCSSSNLVSSMASKRTNGAAVIFEQFSTWNDLKDVNELPL